MKDAFSLAKALIDEKLKKGTPVIVALEGSAASGKTTLAGQLAREFQAPVISMDEFFLPPALRRPERFQEPGGNIHYERFEQEVALPLRAGKPFSYRIFDCQRMDFHGEKSIGPCPVILVEGVYSLHPHYQDIYGLRLFLRTAPEIQDVRLRARGEWLYQRFKTHWLPMEKRYFDTFHPENLCDAILET